MPKYQDDESGQILRLAARQTERLNPSHQVRAEVLVAEENKHTLGPLILRRVPGCWAVVSRSRAQTLLK